MELKISCDASVKLKRMNGITKVNCTVHDYEIDKDTLSGNIKIEGKYIKDNLDEEYDFSELVPFTVVFRDENFKLNKITCQNFNFSQIVNQGLECHFDIIIDYTKEGVEEVQEVENDIDMFEAPNLGEEIIKEVEDLTEDEKISEKYDEMLKDILSKRNDNFFDQNEAAEARIADIEEASLESDEDTQSLEENRLEDEVIEIPVEVETEPTPVSLAKEDEVIEKKDKKMGVNISSSEKKERINPFSKTLKEKYDNYKVYYLKRESEVDQICKLENVSINDVYEDFTKNKRIIIK